MLDLYQMLTFQWFLSVISYGKNKVIIYHRFMDLLECRIDQFSLLHTFHELFNIFFFFSSRNYFSIFFGSAILTLSVKHDLELSCFSVGVMMIEWNLENKSVFTLTFNFLGYSSGCHASIKAKRAYFHTNSYSGFYLFTETVNIHVTK